MPAAKSGGLIVKELGQEKWKGEAAQSVDAKISASEKRFNAPVNLRVSPNLQRHPKEDARG